MRPWFEAVYAKADDGRRVCRHPNKNIGHSLIPEVRDLYEAWLRFTVKDTAEQLFTIQDFFKADGMLDERAHIFNELAP